jgi:GTP-binding protein EngB required for normal cell division
MKNENINIIGNIINKFGLSALNRRLTAINELLQKNNNLDVSVIGQFKAGKSSLINSLIGFNILPIGVIPVTSVITLISYGKKEKFKLVANDGEITETNINKIDDYIIEKNNPGNEKQILRIEIETQALSNAKGLRFIDTPGLGSLYKSSNETTINWIPETGIVLVAINSIQPLSASDITLIHEALSHSPFVTIILTKTDLLDNGQLKECQEFVKQSLSKEFGREFTIAEYSIFHNEALHKNHLWEHCLLPYFREKEKIHTNLLEYKFHSLVNNAVGYLKIAYAASQKEFLKREGLRAYILDERTHNEILRKDLEMISSLYAGKSRMIIEENVLKQYKESITRRLESEYLERFPSWSGNISKVTLKYESWIKEALSEALLEVLRNENTGITQHLQKSKSHFNHYVKAFRESLNGKINEIFGLTLPEQDWEVEIPKVDFPDIFVRPAFDIHLDMLGPLFPMLFLRGLIKRFFFKQIGEEVDINLSRLVSDLSSSTNIAITKLNNQAFDFINTEISTIEKLLSGSESSFQNLEKILQSLEELI